MKKVSASSSWDRIAESLESAVLQSSDGELLAEADASERADHVRDLVLHAIVESRRKNKRSLAYYLNWDRADGTKFLDSISSPGIGPAVAYSDEDEVDLPREEDPPPSRNKR